MKAVFTLVAVLGVTGLLRAQMTFTNTQNLTVGNTPFEVIMADVNGDGRPDLICANQSDNTISVLTNAGGGTFLLSSNYVVGSGPLALTAADVNGDGSSDLIVANQNSDSLTVLINNGQGQFALAGTYATLGDPLTAVTAADVNGDGKADLITTTVNGYLEVFTNDGAGNFKTFYTYYTGTPLFANAAADVNGDGRVDIICAESGAGFNNDNLFVFNNNGNTNFSLGATYPTGTTLGWNLVATDMNGDGNVDLVIPDVGNNFVLVYTNNGSGGFSLGGNFAVGDSPYYVAVADINGDGRPDLISANLDDNSLSVLVNNGSGGFVTATTLSTPGEPAGLAAGDVNGDGEADLVCANIDNNTLSIFLNQTPYGPPGPPIITQQPAGMTNAFGITAWLNVSATVTSGPALFNYQWRFNGTNLPAATNNPLVLTLNQSGNYDVIVSDAAGSVTSAPAPMLVETSLKTFVNGLPAAGTVYALGSATVAFAGGYPGGSIFYTLDGSTPTTDSTLYTGTITVTNSLTVTNLLTVSALALSSDFSQSNYATPVNLQIIPVNAVTFTNTQTLAVGSFPSDTIIADVNGDGLLDLICANHGDNTISVLTNAGGGTFLISSNYVVGSGPVALAAADFNGDGSPDLVVANQNSDSLTVLTNNGQGQFAIAGTYATLGSPSSAVTAADVNGDGKVDIITTTYSGQVLVLTNDGTGNFKTFYTYNTGTHLYANAAADVNGDGRVDIICADGTGGGNVYVFTNTGNTNFSLNATYPTGTTLGWNLVATDMNGDGNVDFAIPDLGNNFILVYTNNGSGGFSLEGNFPVGANAYYVAVADINGDGRPDLISANEGGNSLSVLVNNGVGGFVTATNLSTPSPVGLAAGDVNADGKADLVCANYYGNTLSIFLNQTPYGPASVPIITQQPAGMTNVFGITVALNVSTTVTSGPALFNYQWQFNGADLLGATNNPLILTPSQSGNYDVVVSDAAGSVTSAPASVLVQNTVEILVNGLPAAGTVSPLGSASVTFAGGYPGGSIFYTLDGSMPTTNSSLYTVPITVTSPVMVSALALSADFSQSNYATPVNLQVIPFYSVSFTNTQTLTVGDSPSGVIMADVNGDGRPDLICANQEDNTISVLTNAGGGTFLLSSTYVVGNFPASLAAADFNGDGSPDLVVANQNSDSLTVLTNNGEGQFALAGTYATVGNTLTAVTAADVNGDGKVDLISTANNGYLEVFTNDGAGNFKTFYTYYTGTPLSGNAAADVDGDGRVDIICADGGGESDNIYVFTNNGNTNFSLSATYLTGDQLGANLVATDVNGDGKVDLVLPAAGRNAILVMTNNGSGGFSLEGNFPVGSNPFYVAVADINGDGRPDLISANWGGESLSVLVNNGVGGFITATNLSTPSPVVLAAGDINGDGKADLVCANYNGNTLQVFLNQTPYGPASVPIITQPPSGVTNLFGTIINLSVSATVTSGPALFNYQWQFNGTNLPSGTNNPLILTPNQSGNYDVVVSDAVGSVTSAPASVLVLNTVETLVNGQPAAGTVSTLGSATVTFAGGYPGGLIFYTLEGSTPTTSSTLYTGPITMTSPVMVSALALSADFSQSNYATPVNLQIIPVNAVAFTNTQTLTVGSNSIAVIMADVNGDGRQDLICANQGDNTVTVLTNAGWWTFLAAGNYAVGRGPVALAAADFNGDGSLDFVVANQNSDNLMVFTNNGKGVFAQAGTYGTSGDPSSAVTAADVNGDGKVDLITATYSGYLEVFTNDGTGNFKTFYTHYTDTHLYANAAADVNGDGLMDIICADGAGGGNVYVFTNAGNTNFSLSATYPTGDQLGVNMVATNVNGDGEADLILPDYGNSSILVYTNNGSGGFSTEGDFPVAAGPYYVAVADVNGDGRPDLISSSHNGNSITVLTNNGSAGFVAATNISTEGPMELAAGDVNGDGKPDLVCANYEANTLSVFLNLTLFGPPSIPMIIRQPMGVTNLLGTSVSLVVEATATGPYQPLTYQWQFNGDILPGSTNNPLFLTLNQNGNYDVIVSDATGSVTSSPALLMVTPLTLTVPVMQGNGGFQFGFDTALGVNYEIDYSTNLINWYQLEVLGGTGMPATFTDTNAPSNPQSFYRIIETAQ